MRLCRFKNLLGVPNEGPHSIRFMNFAIVDVILTLIGAYFIAKKLKVEYWKALLGFFVLGIFLHWLFCVPTQFNKLIGLA